MADRIISITLPEEAAQRLDRLASAQGHTLDQLVHEAIDAYEDSIDPFMEEEVLPAYQEYLRNPSSALTSEQLRESIEATSHELHERNGF
jgi:predicted DNA-binding protein